jgi:hypothetical protein
MHLYRKAIVFITVLLISTPYAGLLKAGSLTESNTK